MRLADASGRKGLSAMVRVKNEEEFLYPAVKSIADCVDELVLIDNLSSDRSPSILETVRREYPGKTVLEKYPHEIRKVGRENWELSSSEDAESSPHLSANYYNWCLARCAGPYVLKWDGDMVALDSFHESLAEWKSSEAQVMVFNGGNVHPNRRNLIAARTSDRKQLLEQLSVPGLPHWATSLTYDFPEPRVFPKLGARYHCDLRWTQELSSPALGRSQAPGAVMRVEGACFLHLKFCKRDSCAGYSPDLADVIASNVSVGPPLSPEFDDALRRWELAR